MLWSFITCLFLEFFFSTHHISSKGLHISGAQQLLMCVIQSLFISISEFLSSCSSPVPSDETSPSHVCDSSPPVGLKLRTAQQSSKTRIRSHDWWPGWNIFRSNLVESINNVSKLKGCSRQIQRCSSVKINESIFPLCASPFLFCLALSGFLQTQPTYTWLWSFDLRCCKTLTSG